MFFPFLLLPQTDNAAVSRAPAKATEAKELSAALQKFAKDHGLSTDVEKAYKLHMKQAVAKNTLDGLGIHCPYDAQADIGYRPSSVTTKELKALLQKVRLGQNCRRLWLGTARLFIASKPSLP